MKEFGSAMFFALILLSAICSADNQYRCNGRVQYRPCEHFEQPVDKPGLPRNIAKVRSSLLAKKIDPHFARVVSHKFRKLTPNRGEWTGVVHGRGEVNLKLMIYRARILEATRYMGSVILKSAKDTSFNFRSSIPKGSGWSTEIIAWAKPIS